MLTAYPTPREGASPVWIDLFDPNDKERHQIRTDYGIEIPSRAELSEIESSSRLVNRDGLVRLSLPLIPSDGGDAMSPPLGFVLTGTLLVTVRFSDVHAMEQVRPLFNDAKTRTSVDVFVALLEAMVDYGADLLEHLNGEVAAISRASFKRYAVASQDKARSSRTLRTTLVTVGSLGERLSEIRETLLGLQRIAPFVSETCKDWLGGDALSRLQTVRRDLASLADFETHLSNKVQFLLDAVLGFINTEQNEIFKVLTIASVVGIPPTLIASMYGMNFKNMPELSWSYGYEFGLLLIVISTVLPILWFKSRGWW